MIAESAAGPRRSKIVPAARLASIDYRTIVANAVAGLAKNTPDARRDVYAEARAVVHRHLQLMRLPEPIIEMEKLALDLTIRKIERQARIEQAVAQRQLENDQPSQGAAPDAVAKPPTTVGDAARSFVDALKEASQALAALVIVLGLRPVFYGIWKAATPLRFVGRTVFSPVGLAAGVPIAAMLIVTFFLLDSNAGSHSAMSLKAAQFLERVDVWLHGAPPGTKDAAGKDVAVKDVEQINSRPAAAPAPTPEPVRARVTTPATRIATTLPAETGGVAARARQPASFATTLADASKEISNGVPKWFTGYAHLVEAGPPLTTMGAAAPDNALEPAPAQPAAAPPAAPTLASANSLAAIPDDRPAIALTPLRNPLPKAAALIEAGKKAALSDDLEKAVQDFTEATRIDPNHPGAYTERGQALFKLGETDRAINDYSTALKKDANYGPALRGRAMANLYRGSTDLALGDLSKAIQIAEIDPSRLPPLELFYARRSRANIYGTKSQPEGEIADCTALIEAYKHDRTLSNALLTIYQAEGATNLVASIYRQRANAYIRLSKPDLAREDLTSAVALSADRGFSALLDRARLNEANGQRDQAIADLQAALGIRPGSEEARIALRRISANATQPRAAGRI
jgi:tetratricopeptide (TPR) repeat protein